MAIKKIKYNPFNQISIYHVYDYYDEPILYSFTSETGQLYIANFIDYEEKSDTNVCAFLPVTFDKLRYLENGNISLLDLYKNPISDIAFIEKKGLKKDEFFIQKTSEIEPRCLPDKDSFIKYENSRKKQQNIGVKTG